MTDPNPEVILKQCSKCGETKPTSHFHRDRSRRDGLFPQCRTCTSRDKAVHRAQHLDEEKARAAAYYRRNADKVKKRVARYYAENHERARKSRSDYRASHRDELAAYRARNAKRIKETTAVYRMKNADRIRQAKARYNALHAERIKEYKARHRAEKPEQKRFHEARRRAIKRGLPATLSLAEWERCLQYWDYRCAVCGRQQGLWHILSQDHWISVARRGAYTAENILPLCHGTGGCNNSKNSRDGHEWLISKFGERKAAKIEQRIQRYFDWVKGNSDGEHD